MASFEDQLRAEYVEKIDGLVQALETASHSFRTGDPGAESSIRRIAHMLRGSGATYGFPDISHAAQSVEESAESDLLAELDGLLSVLRRTTHTPDAKSSILLIDDDDSSAQLLKVVLSSPEREIYIAYDATEARGLIEEHHFSLIVLDIVLSDADGRDFLMKLRQSPKTASVPVIVVTGLVGDQPRQECMALGATHFFTKPYNLKQIGQTVTDELQKQQVSQSDERTDLDAGLPNRAEFCVRPLWRRKRPAGDCPHCRAHHRTTKRRRHAGAMEWRRPCGFVSIGGCEPGCAMLKRRVRELAFRADVVRRRRFTHINVFGWNRRRQRAPARR